DKLALLEREGEIAADYLEALLDIADLAGDIDMDVEGERAKVSIAVLDEDAEDPEAARELQRLVGPDGKVLEALQDLVRQAVFEETGCGSRSILVMAGYRERRRELLSAFAQRCIEDAQETGHPVRLAPMIPFERKIVHDVVA